MRFSHHALGIFILLTLAFPSAAQTCLTGFCTSNIPTGQCGLDVTNCEAGVSYPSGHICHGSGAGGFLNCREPIVSDAPEIEVIEEPDGEFTARLVMEVTAPYNYEAGDEDGEHDNPNGTLDMLWFSKAQVCDTSGSEAICEYFNSDSTRCYVEATNLTCDGAPYDFGTYSLRAQVCGGDGPCGAPFPGPSAGRWTDRNNLDFVVTKAMLKCEPPTEECEDCNSCKRVGPGQAPVGGDEGRAGPFIGKTDLRYTARGAGAPNLPGSLDWLPVMGRYWSHTYAQRIILDPDETHVWLITDRATYREYGNLAGGVYETLRPSNDYRTLHRTGTGWELHDLDGTVMEFDGSGRWISTTDRHGNATTGTYTGSDLTEVSLPDGRLEQFTYSGSRLAAVTEVGIDATTRTWTLTWTGDDLTRLDRPDGTAWVMTYGDASFPGYMTLLELEGTDGTRRVETGWEYDTEGNVVTLWSGDTTPGGSGAVDVWSLSFDDPADPAVTTLTDPLGQVTTYEYGDDPTSERARLSAISGDCPSCGLAPNTTFAYTDTANPMRPTSMTDGEGNTTTYTYDADGRMLTRTEAAGTTEERTTTWTYAPTYPALVATMSRPSVEAGQDRETIFTRDATGNVLSREIRGYEAGQPFDCTASGAPCYETAMTYNAAGQVETVDPPGYATGEVTSYTYDPARGDLIADSRTDPLVGTTTYDHDGYHRRTSVTDVNGVVTETVYDDLDRVVKTIQRGPDGAVETDDLITEHEYNVFGDLIRTTLPEGNLIQYGYDAAGRLISIQRKPDLATPGERTLFTLDAAGNRTREDLQRWDTSLGDWVTESTTSYLFSSRCHVDQVLQADGSVTEFEYDCNGNLTRTWDANHPSAGKTNPATAVYAYDALDRLTTVSRPWAGAGGGTSTTTYGYDVQDHLTSVTDAEQNTTTYTYSDRDLLTQEVSPVAGTTTHTYNPHGELVSTTDARGITTTRTVDELDRVTFVDYPDATLDTTYTYGTSPALFEVGRLTGITRDGQTVAYSYDRFGRTTQDGDLTFGYDKNGNRTAIGYPGGVTADYTFDFADRETNLAVTTPAGTTDVVTGTSYLPSGPLSTLTFGTGAWEDRAFTSRYFPNSFVLTASRGRTWDYTTDAVGNPTEIVEAAVCPGDLILANATVTTAELYESCDGITAGPDYTVAAGGDLDLRAATRIVITDGFKVESGGTLSAGTDPTLADDVTKTYDYQDFDYFLTSATGPWGAHSWTYDKIGNRLTETDNGATDTYSYLTNGAGGNTAQLDSIALSTLGTRSYTYTPAGHVEDVTAGANVVDFTWNDAGRLAASDRATDTAAFLYDGRSFLRQGGDAAGPGLVLPTYDSSGLLHCLQRQIPTGTTNYHIFYLAGRPVGQVALESGQPERWWYFTTDHLGTPVVATDAAQDELWVNRFDPFGEDPFAGTSSGASDQEIFLRFPGQWDDPVWRDAMMGAEGYQNVHRWYTPATGRYTRTDPLGISASVNSYDYVNANPLRYIDPLGLCYVELRFNEISGIPAADHAYVLTIGPNSGANVYRGGPGGSGGGSSPSSEGDTCCEPKAPVPLGFIKTQTAPFEPGRVDFDPKPSGRVVLQDDNSSCACLNKCLKDQLNFIQGSNIPYNPVGANSNATARHILESCGFSGVVPPDNVSVPGWNTSLPPPPPPPSPHGGAL